MCLQAGACPLQRDSCGLTPLHLAAQFGHTAVAHLLLQPPPPCPRPATRMRQRDRDTGLHACACSVAAAA